MAKHVLFIGFVWPEPKSSAAGQNILSYVQACLAQNWQVSFCSAAETTNQTFNLSNIGVNTFSISLNCSSFNQQVHALQPDIVIFDRFLSFEQFAWRVKESWPEALLVLDCEDLHFLRDARHQLNKILQKTQNSSKFMQSNDILDNRYNKLLLNNMCLRELACIYQADLSLVLSDFEKNLLVKQFNAKQNQVAHTPFILNDSIALHQYPVNFEQKEDFVFIGNFRHAPNYHAVKVLAEQCWPAIYKMLKPLHPNISCHVYGAYMSPKAKQLENRQLRFYVHGYASDQLEVIGNARVMLAPITFGAGVKGKLLDAMQVNTPSITSPIGAEGITNQQWAGSIVDSLQNFIHEAVEHYTNPQKWQKAKNNSQLILSQQYCSDRNTKLLITSLQHALTNMIPNRESNFMQQLLWQRQFQTSAYMSQWIEAKNKFVES